MPRRTPPSQPVDAREHFAETMLEKGPGGLQETVEERLKSYGWRAYHTHDSRSSAAGFPDIVAPRAGVLLFAELKRQREELTRDQADWRAAIELVIYLSPNSAPDTPMYGRCVQYWLWRPMDLFDGLIDQVLL